MTRLTIISFSAGFDSAIMLNVEVLPIPMLPNPIGNWNWHSALASLGVFASLWVANPRKGRLRQHFHIGNISTLATFSTSILRWTISMRERCVYRPLRLLHPM